MKRTVEKDLLRILKHKKDNELFYTVFNMVNGTYKYEFPYLNKMSYEELILYIEKLIMTQTTYRSDFKKLEDYYKLIDEFISKVRTIKEEDLDKNSLLSIKYDLEIKFNKIKTSKKEKAKISALVLSFVLFFSLMGKTAALSKEEKEDINTDYKIELENSNSNITSYEKEYEALNRTWENIEKTLGVKFQDSETPIVIIDEECDVVEPEVYYDQNTTSKPDENEMQVVNAQPVISVDERINYICSEYNLTRNEFNVVAAICMAEAKEGNYTDTYAVISVIYNRCHNTRWVNWIGKVTGISGNSLYAQVIANGQFNVYSNGRYKKFLNITEGDSFLAILDMLETKQPSHDYLSFRSSGTNMKKAYEQFVEGGNKYFELMPENERIKEEGRSL